MGPAVSRASLKADLANACDQATRLAARVAQLERKLSELLGQQVWRQSGLGAPDDVEELKTRITVLDQEKADVGLKLEERAAELEASRAMGRELTKTLNQIR